MKIHEAYTILEVEASISDEELKSHYKKLAKKYHPDIHKEDPEKFKSINSAFQAVEAHRKNPRRSPFMDDESDLPFNMNDIFSGGFGGFGGFRQQGTPFRNPKPINLTETISFRESVLGVSKEVQYKREVKCGDCNGIGFSKQKNNCAHCDGFGQIIKNMGNMISHSTCGYCRGKVVQNDCETCKKKTFVANDTKINVQIPPGIQNNNTIQLGGMGNFAAPSVFGDQYSSLLINVRVENNTTLSLDGMDVICPIQISLLDALRGMKKMVPSIDGETVIDIPAKSRHKEEVIMDRLGVNREGRQRVILDIVYPEDTSEIVNMLEGKKDKNVSNTV